MLKNNRNMILKRRGGLEQDPVHKHLWHIMLNFLLTNYYFIYTVIIIDDNFSQGTSILTINFLEHAIHAL